MSAETDQIERDLDQSRHRLNDTLEQIGSKLSPGQMLDEVLGLAQGQAGQFATKLGKQVMNNPMPTLLIGAGIAMLMTQKDGHAHISADDWHSERRFRSLEEARWATPRMPNETDIAYNDRVHDAYAKALDLKQRAGEALDAFKQRVSDAANSVEDAATSARHRLSQTFSGAAAFAQHQGQRLGERAAGAKATAGHFYEDNPLVAGALALAVGAMIGSATPLSEAERKSLSGVADKAANMGADIAERGARMVEERADALH